MNPVWLEHAFKDKGVAEVKGGENPRIIEMHSHTTLKAKEDEIAWCSSGLCCWMEESGLPSTKSAAAKSWFDYGIGLAEPRIGCICLIRQKQKGSDAATGSTSGYHVGLWLREEAGRVYLWGCNQSDSVKESGFNLQSYEIVAYRWPEGVE